MENRIKFLKANGAAVDIIYFSKNIAKSHYYLDLDNMTIGLPHMKNFVVLNMILYFLPFSIARRSIMPSDLKKIKEILRSRTYDYCLVESQRSYFAWSQLESRINAHVIYLRVHNIESLYYFSLFKSAVKTLRYFEIISCLLESILYTIKEFFVLSKNTHYKLAFISSNEIISSANSCLMPYIPFPQSSTLRFEEIDHVTQINIVYTGNLMVSDNQDYIDMLINASARFKPTVNIHIHVVGRAPSELLKLSIKNITFYGLLPSKEMLKILNKSRFALNIAGNSQGIKTKFFEYLSYRLLVISNQNGLSGITTSPHIFPVVNSEFDIVETITHLIESSASYKALLSNQQTFYSNYISDAISKNLTLFSL